jgi:hypothetical protein
MEKTGADDRMGLKTLFHICRGWASRAATRRREGRGKPPIIVNLWFADTKLARKRLPGRYGTKGSRQQRNGPEQNSGPRRLYPADTGGSASRPSARNQPGGRV